ncbi:MAG: AMP-binding protein [Chloroflexi bacterium]|nr:AMP-binding protein [Chloroflexota bacterium]MBU1747226.1 AMP-binding protein [Chloroflexota bacterium]
MPSDAVLLYRLLEEAADAYGDRPALVYRDVPLTLERVREQMNRLASSLQQALAVDPGQRVAIHLPNMPQFLIAAHALWKLGVVVVPLDPAADADQLAQQLMAAQARVILTLDATYATVMAAQPTTSVEHVLVARVNDYVPFWPKLRDTLFRAPKGPTVNWRETPRFVYPYTNMVLHNPLPDPVAVGPDDPALLQCDELYTHRDLWEAVNPAISAAGEPAVRADVIPFWQFDGLITALRRLYAGDTLVLDAPAG